MNELEKQRKSRRIRGAYALTWRSILTVLLAGLLMLFVERIADALIPDMANVGHYIGAGLSVCLLIFFTLYWQHDRISKQISARAEILNVDDIEDRPYLICGYSPITLQPNGELTAEMAKTLNHLGNDLEKAVALKDRELGSWQQNLRVLSNLKGVKHLYILRPNRDQTDQFVQVLRNFFPEDQLAITLIADKRGNTDHFEIDAKRHVEPDYENFEYVTTGIDLAIKAIQKDLHLSEAEVEEGTTIDVTAGLKTFSIAAAITSLNRDLLFVYAGTGEKEGQVLAYNASIQVGTALEL